MVNLSGLITVALKATGLMDKRQGLVFLGRPIPSRVNLSTKVTGNAIDKQISVSLDRIRATILNLT